jgi:UDP-2,4-diacetamido-2,4,6-trideoxy-beta-L-altropyranose hydrolase
MTFKSPLLIRADAGAQIGTGHIMRCLALAQSWQDSGGEAIFLTAPLPALEARLKSEGFQTIPSSADAGSAKDAEETEAWARKAACGWVVADGYRFGDDFQRRLKESGRPLLIIDDYGHASHYSAAMVLNQNLYASERFYARREPDTRLLLGTDYVLLRREFLEQRGPRRKFPEKARKILVTLGGSDAPNATKKVLEALQPFEDGEVTVLAGASNPHFDELTSFARKTSAPCRVEKNVVDVPGWMRWADLAVFAGGTTSYEMAFMGVPGLTLVLADNQRRIAEGFSARGASVSLGWHADTTREKIAAALADLRSSAQKRSAMSRLGQEMVDGRGARRVSAELLRPRK